MFQTLVRPLFYALVQAWEWRSVVVSLPAVCGALDLSSNIENRGGSGLSPMTLMEMFNIADLGLS